jgi:cyclic dehypoxanthinyl futalosine synthase
MSFEDALKELISSGLDSLPGGGAEILVDKVRGQISPEKCTADEWLDVMRISHGLGLQTTATMMFGHIESRADRVEHLKRLRDLQDETGGFVAFIPWTFQPGDTPLAERVKPATGVEYLRTLAVSRIFLDNIPHIGASWLTQGKRMAAAALHFGADDIGSIMLEENVVAAAGCSHHITEAELRDIIEGAGFIPRRRDAVYNHVDNA